MKNIENLIQDSIEMSQLSLSVKDPSILTGDIVTMGENLIQIKSRLNELTLKLNGIFNASTEPNMGSSARALGRMAFDVAQELSNI